MSNTKLAVNTVRPAQSLCTAELQFVDACGTALARRAARIAPGASSSLDVMVPPIDPELPPGPCADPPGSVDPPDPDADPPGGVTRADPPGSLSETDPPEPDRARRLRAQVVFRGDAGHCVSSLEVGDPFVGDPTGLRTGGAFIHPGLIVGFNPQPDPPGAPTPGVVRAPR